jgi:hypothetical protein
MTVRGASGREFLRRLSMASREDEPHCFCNCSTCVVNAVVVEKMHRMTAPHATHCASQLIEQMLLKAASDVEVEHSREQPPKNVA